MNYLAHVFLSNQTPEAITGAMLGDFVKGRLSGQWSAEVLTAIELHRAIDRYTDHHPIVVSSRGLISPLRRRFAGILIDIFYDHFLARHWGRYHRLPLKEFTRTIYAVLLPQRAALPERLQHLLPFMERDDWLASYADIESVDLALKGIRRRFRFPDRAQALDMASLELEKNYTEFEQHFLEFLPHAQKFVTEFTSR